MRMLEVGGSQKVLRNLLILIMLAGSFFALRLPNAHAGTVVVYVPCWDGEINLLAACAAFGMCADSQGVTFIEIFPYIGDYCSVSPVFNEAIGNISPSGNGMLGTASAIVFSNGLPMGFHENNHTCDGTVTDVFDYEDLTACINAPPWLGFDGGGGECQGITCDPGIILPPGAESCCPSPILIDVEGNGFNLTSAAGGVALI